MSGPTSSDGGPTDRLSERTAGCGRRDRRLLVPYLTAGYPTLAATTGLMHAVVRGGADIIELGVPFSDPLADGPTIQASSQAALENGASLATTLEAVRSFRSRDGATPVVVFTYLNPVYRYGIDEFIRDAVDAGADGVLLTDLPLASDPDLEGRLEGSALALVRLIAPTTPRDRAEQIAARSQGFLYYISRTGVTGARSELRAELEEEVSALREVASVPVVVGFGISSPDQARSVGAAADGVVVGSALIERIGEEGVDAAEAFVASLRRGLDGAS